MSCSLLLFFSGVGSRVGGQDGARLLSKLFGHDNVTRAQQPHHQAERFTSALLPGAGRNTLSLQAASDDFGRGDTGGLFDDFPAHLFNFAGLPVAVIGLGQGLSVACVRYSLSAC